VIDKSICREVVTMALTLDNLAIFISDMQEIKKLGLLAPNCISWTLHLPDLRIINGTVAQPLGVLAPFSLGAFPHWVEQRLWHGRSELAIHLAPSTFLLIEAIAPTPQSGTAGIDDQKKSVAGVHLVSPFTRLERSHS
jgi:hypothetical protein